VSVSVRLSAHAEVRTGVESRGRIKEIKSQSPTSLYIRCRYQIPEIYLWGFPTPYSLFLLLTRLSQKLEGYRLVVAED
jgi:hypothetical protein